MLYSVELRSRCFLNCDAKVRPFFESAKNKTDFFQKKLCFLLGGLFKRGFLVGLLLYEPVVEHVPADGDADAG